MTESQFIVLFFYVFCAIVSAIGFGFVAMEIRSSRNYPKPPTKEKKPMAINMSYCQFINTYEALQECQQNITEPLSDAEHTYRIKLIKLCRTIARDFEDYSDSDLQELQDDEYSDSDLQKISEM